MKTCHAGVRQQCEEDSHIQGTSPNTFDCIHHSLAAFVGVFCVLGSVLSISHPAFHPLSLVPREETEMWAGRGKSPRVMQPASRVPGQNLNPAYLSDSVAQALSTIWVS